MKSDWKQIRIEIDSLPTTEKTVCLKKLAREFEKELRQQLRYLEKNYPNASARIHLTKEILGES